MLFDPFTLNGLTLPNRICVPAMVTRLCGEDGFVNQDITERYTAFARGEAGLIVVEAMAVHHEWGRFCASAAMSSSPA